MKFLPGEESVPGWEALIYTLAAVWQLVY